MEIKTKYNPGDIVYHVKGCISLKNNDLKILMLRIRTCRCILGNKENPCYSPVYLCDVISEDIINPRRTVANNVKELDNCDWPEEDLLTYAELNDILLNKKHFFIATLEKLDECHLVTVATQKMEED